ncbi:winged helix-turn-helix domain-containing protein [Leucothrix sargassi]|nr:winged helix-turn-helix domain-containing protein [Leucothrix sargassi]
MINHTLNETVDLKRLRQLALNSQGLQQPKPFGSGIKGAIKAIKHTGYVQIDTISVVERAHNHVIYSRVPDYKPSMLNQMLLNADIFEYWTHAAAFIPIEDFRFSLPFKHSVKTGSHPWFKDKNKKLMGELLARISADGPIRSRDLENNAKKREGWWDWKPAKQALEQLYMEGDLMVCDREGFQKSYDLTERVLPSHINAVMPTVSEFAEHIVDQQLRCHGFVSLKGFTYLRRNTELRKAVKNLIQESLSEGRLEQIKLESGEAFFLKSGALDTVLSRLDKRLQILSPFDNAVIQRDRLKSIFQFDYLIECYVPAAKRQYGYFSLPLLFQAEFIGRMDCKAHRKDKHFEIKTLHLEAIDIDQELFVAAFAEAVIDFCGFNACGTVSLTEAYPKQLAPKVRVALNSR